MARPGRKNHVVTAMRALALLTALGLPLPALADEPGRDEGLALRLIFDECLGYARDGTPPLAGIAAPAPDDAAVRALAADFPASATRLRLVDQDYVAFWGSEGGRRFCAVVEATQDTEDGLRVAPGFLDRADDRAMTEGLVQEMSHEAYGRRDTRWREARHADDPARGIIVSVSIGPTGSETEHVQALGASGPVLLAK
jgi:hypothetical protein